MSEQQKQLLFELWLEDKLTPEQQQAFVQLCAQEPEWEQKANLAGEIQQQAASYHEHEVPKWDAAATFAADKKQPWWSWSGLPAMAFATSMLAIVMVVARVEIQLIDKGLSISFAGSSEQQLQQLVEQKLQNFQQQQQNLLVSYSQDLRDAQLQTNTELSRYLIDSSRSERREDFAELIKYVNQQRSDDQLFYARQINKLQQQVLDNPQQDPWSAPDSVEQ